LVVRKKGDIADLVTHNKRGRKTQGLWGGAKLAKKKFRPA